MKYKIIQMDVPAPFRFSYRVAGFERGDNRPIFYESTYTLRGAKRIIRKQLNKEDRLRKNGLPKIVYEV